MQHSVGRSLERDGHEDGPSIRQAIGDTAVIVRDPLTMNSWENPETRGRCRGNRAQETTPRGAVDRDLRRLSGARRDQVRVRRLRGHHACGGSGAEDHEMAQRRMGNDAAAMTTWISLACELQRSWDRTETVPGLSQIIIDH